MSDWKKRNHEICIPGMDTPKTHICKVCGSKIVPRRENRYTAKIGTGEGWPWSCYRRAAGNDVLRLF